MNNIEKAIDKILSKFPHTKYVETDIENRKKLKISLNELCKNLTKVENPVVNKIRSYNIGESDYSKRSIQPWDIILMYNLNFFDGSILKYLLRKKFTEPREKDYEKIIHYCQERLRQIEETKLK